MRRWIVVVSMVLVSHIAFAGSPALAPYKGKDLTVSFPKGWTVVQQDNVYVAQQDPKRKDAADILFIFAPATANATEDQLLDAITSQTAKDLKVTKRAAASAGAGHFLIGDGTVEGMKVRLGALAVIANNQMIICVLVSKTGDFDALGGIGLATQVATSLQLDAPPPPPPPAAPANTPTNQQVTNGGKLTVPPPTRALAIADLVGEWSQDDQVIQGYTSASTGAHAGYSAVATSERWQIDGKGVLYSVFTGTSSSSSSGTYQINTKTFSTLTIAGGLLTITPKKGAGAPKMYWIRGWEARPDITVLKLNGPYYEASQIEDRVKTDLAYAYNLDQYWVRVTKPK